MIANTTQILGKDQKIENRIFRGRLATTLVAIIKLNQANYDEVQTRLCRGCFVLVVVYVVDVVLNVVAVHKGLVGVDKSLSDTH